MEWKTPEISILVRSKPEEVVLSYCKGGPTNGPVGEVGGMCSSGDCEFNCLTINDS